VYNSEANVRQFQSLPEAVSFLAECLESGSAQELLSELGQAEKLIEWQPEYLTYFEEAIFAQLRELHQETD
jgi:hypothetical protein